MKSGSVQKLPNGEVQLVLTEGDVEVCVSYPVSEEEAQKILEQWKAGTYRLLQG